MLTEVVNHLWQSTLFAALVAALMTNLRDHGAHVRYWLWWAASVKFVVPFSLLTLLGSSLGANLWRPTPLIDLVDWRQTLQFLEPMRTPRIWTTPTRETWPARRNSPAGWRASPWTGLFPCARHS